MIFHDISIFYKALVKFGLTRLAWRLPPSNSTIKFQVTSELLISTTLSVSRVLCVLGFSHPHFTQDALSQSPVSSSVCIMLL